ncbi:MAG: hypothetical protein EYC67_00155 [Betaproteobacteria bacterium]|nr:MAG: hypothetical protein EYC67_00155 [Betaproteobacteria bacterium]
MSTPLTGYRYKASSSTSRKDRPTTTRIVMRGHPGYWTPRTPFNASRGPLGIRLISIGQLRRNLAEETLQPRSEDDLRVAFEQMIEPLRAAFEQLPVQEYRLLRKADPLEACMALLQRAAKAGDQPRLARNLRAFEAREALTREAGGMITPSQLAQKLGKSRQTLKDWGDAHKILWVDNNGTRTYPLCQFDAHGQLLPGLDRFLQTLARIGITGWMALETLLGVDPKYAASPLTLLQQGRIDDALTCARSLGDAGAA